MATPLDCPELWLATPQAAEHFRADVLLPSDRHRYERVQRAAKRRDFAVSRALLAHLDLAAAPLGALAHSGGMAVLLRTNEAVAAGVDIETHLERRFDSLARFAFTAEEAAAIEAAEPQERTRLFYALWTLKEALAKALRRPLLEVVRHCSFKTIDGELRGSIPDPRPWSARVFQPRANVSVAVAFVGMRTPPRLQVQEWPVELGPRWKEPYRVVANEAPRSK